MKVLILNLLNETLDKPRYFLCRHAGECQHPVRNCFDWILACASMTVKILVQRFLKCWSVLRRLSGDDAYERYLEHWHAHHGTGIAPPDRTTFSRNELARRWNGIRRCC